MNKKKKERIIQKLKQMIFILIFIGNINLIKKKNIKYSNSKKKKTLKGIKGTKKRRKEKLKIKKMKSK